MNLRGSAAETLLYTRDVLEFQVCSKSEPVLYSCRSYLCPSPNNHTLHNHNCCISLLLSTVPHITLQYQQSLNPCYQGSPHRELK